MAEKRKREDDEVVRTAILHGKRDIRIEDRPERTVALNVEYDRLSSAARGLSATVPELLAADAKLVEKNVLWQYFTTLAYFLKK